MILNNHFTPAWNVIENFKHFLNVRDKKNYTENQIAIILKMSGKTLARHKHYNSSLILANLSLYCIEHNLDVRDFCKFNNSITIS